MTITITIKRILKIILKIITIIIMIITVIFIIITIIMIINIMMIMIMIIITEPPRRWRWFRRRGSRDLAPQGKRMCVPLQSYCIIGLIVCVMGCWFFIWIYE